MTEKPESVKAGQKIHSIKHVVRAIFFFAIFCFSGCGFQNPDPYHPVPSSPMDEFTRNLLEQTTQLNQQITQAKGKGWLTLDTDRIKARFRMIWAARTPEQMRITLLDSGHPFETIISDGKKVRLFSHTGAHRPRTGKITGRDMKSLFSVDIPVGHMTRLLLGQIPVSDFTPAAHVPQTLDSQYSTVVITKNNRNALQQVLFWDNRGEIRKILMEKTSGIMVHEIQFELWMQSRQYRIPAQVTIRNKKQETLTLQITDLDPNVSVKPAIFEIRK